MSYGMRLRQFYYSSACLPFFNLHLISFNRELLGKQVPCWLKWRWLLNLGNWVAWDFRLSSFCSSNLPRFGSVPGKLIEMNCVTCLSSVSWPWKPQQEMEEWEDRVMGPFLCFCLLWSGIWGSTMPFPGHGSGLGDFPFAVNDSDHYFFFLQPQ